MSAIWGIVLQKSFCSMGQKSFRAVGAVYRIIMWGTTSTGDELTGSFAGALEDTSTGDCRLFRLFARNLDARLLGLLPATRLNRRRRPASRSSPKSIMLPSPKNRPRHAA